MKVIVAGYNKTGTKSVHAAFSHLGYTVYDFMEHFYCHHKEWNEIFTKGASTELFRRMYENVDVVVDTPALYFWKEIHEAFPEAKILFTIRDNEEIWAKSFARQMRSTNEHRMFTFAKTFTPIGRKVANTVRYARAVQFGVNMPYNWSPFPINESILKLKYRQHNADVLKNAPRDKLLVFRVQDGWEPLCKFLGVDIPDIPFPHKNVKSSLLKDQAKENQLMITMFFEAKVVMFFMLMFVAVLIPACCMMFVS